MYKLSDDGKAVMVQKGGKWHVKHRFASKKEALAYPRALYANVKDARRG